MLMRHIAFVACPLCIFFFTFSHKRHDFRKKKLLNTTCVFIFSNTCVWNISHSKKNWERYDKKCNIVLRVKCLLFLSDRNDTWIFSTIFFKNLQISNYTKIRPVGADLFHADGQTDRHDEANSRFSQFCEKRLKNKWYNFNANIYFDHKRLQNNLIPNFAIKKQDRSRRFYNHTCGYSYIILFLHYLIHTAWWWLFYVAETCSSCGFAIIKLLYRRITSLLLLIFQTQLRYHTFKNFEYFRKISRAAGCSSLICTALLKSTDATCHKEEQFLLLLQTWAIEIFGDLYGAQQVCGSP